MEHSMAGVNRKTLAVIALLLAGALIAVYAFNVSWNTIGFLGLIGFMFLMHGGHGAHGGMCGGHGGDSQTDEHAGHTVDTRRDDNAKAIAPDANARGLMSDEKVKTVSSEESARRHQGC